MPFSAVTTVRLDEGRDPAQDRKILNEWLIPRLKGMAGFQSARFLRSQDGTRGVGAVIFDTESNAKAALDAMATDRPAELAPIESTAIWEVVVEV
jgi:hypothetical protein